LLELPPPHPAATPSKMTSINIVPNRDRRRPFQQRTMTHATLTLAADPGSKLSPLRAPAPDALLMVKAVVCGVNPSRLRIAG